MQRISNEQNILCLSDDKNANYFKGKYFYPLKSSQIKLPATIKTSNDIAARQYYDSNKYVKLL